MKRFDAINMIPFVDIMLVLLAIILTTATFIAQGRLDLTLPSAPASAPPASEAQVVIAIDRNSDIYMNEEPVAPEALPERLAAVDRNSPIQLRVDAAVPFARFVLVIDAVKAQRLERLSIVTRRDP